MKRKTIKVSRYIDILNKLEKQVFITPHAIKQARKRNIFPNMIFATMCGGRIKNYGKNYLKINKRYKQGIVTCVCEKVNENIIIKTVTWRKL